MGGDARRPRICVCTLTPMILFSDASIYVTITRWRCCVLCSSSSYFRYNFGDTDIELWVHAARIHNNGINALDWTLNQHHSPKSNLEFIVTFPSTRKLTFDKYQILPTNSTTGKYFIEVYGNLGHINPFNSVIKHFLREEYLSVAQVILRSYLVNYEWPITRPFSSILAESLAPTLYQTNQTTNKTNNTDQRDSENDHLYSACRDESPSWTLTWNRKRNQDWTPVKTYTG